MSLPGWSDWNREWAIRTLVILVGIVVPLLVVGRGAAAVLVPIIGGLVIVTLPLQASSTLAARWARDPLGRAIGAMLALWIVSVANSVAVGFSLSIWAQVAGLVLLAALLPHLLAERATDHDVVLKILVAASLVGTTIAIAAIHLWPPLLGYVRPVQITHSYEAAQRLKSYAAIMPCLAPVLLWAGLRLRGAWLACGGIAIVFGLLLVVATQNRAAQAGYIGACGLTLIALAVRRLPRTARIATIVALLAVAAMAAVMVVGRLPQMPFDGRAVTGLPTWLIDEHRQVIWGFVWDRGLERPWFGWGPSTANLIPGANDPIPRIGQTYVPLHAHNWVLQLAFDVGFVGLAAAVVTLGLFVRNLGRGSIGNWPALGLTGAFFVSTLANFSIWQSWWQSVFVILLSICLTGSRVKNPQ